MCAAQSPRYSTVAMDRDWEDRADEWLAWARTPGHDAYWHYRDIFFEELVPRPWGRTLEIGCGEGRVSRDLAERGHHVTAVDSSPTLVTYARALDSRRPPVHLRHPSLRRRRALRLERPGRRIHRARFISRSPAAQ